MPEKVKSRRGRRSLSGKDETPHVGFRLPLKITAQIDAWAKACGVTRSQLARDIFEGALRAREGST
jgi:hypothetical protein